MSSLIYSEYLSVIKNGSNSRYPLATYNAEYGDVKQTFSLDKVIWISKGGSSKSSFIGAVDLNGDNLKRHPQSSIMNIRLSQNGKEYALLSDAGVKTSASGNYNNSAKRAVFANFIGVGIDVKSAYFSPITALNISYTIGVPSAWQTIQVAYSSAANTSSSVQIEFSAYNSYNQGLMPYVIFRISILNENRAYYLPDQRVDPDDFLLNEQYLKYNSPNDKDPIYGSVFLSKNDFNRALSLLNSTYDVATGVFAYTTAYFENRVPDGYYEGLTTSLIKISNGELVRLAEKSVLDSLIVLVISCEADAGDDADVEGGNMLREVVVSMYYKNGIVSSKDISLTYSLTVLNSNLNQVDERILYNNGAEGSFPKSRDVDIPKGGLFTDNTGFMLPIQMDINEYMLGFKDVSISFGKIDYTELFYF